LYRRLIVDSTDQSAGALGDTISAIPASHQQRWNELVRSYLRLLLEERWVRKGNNMSLIINLTHAISHYTNASRTYQANSEASHLSQHPPQNKSLAYSRLTKRFRNATSAQDIAMAGIWSGREHATSPHSSKGISNSSIRLVLELESGPPIIPTTPLMTLRYTVWKEQTKKSYTRIYFDSPG
jgi:hypothetical protein